MFRCESDLYGRVVFGAFDGVRSWKVNSFTTVDIVEQELVSAHEERHLRLQQGTPYGAALAVLGAAVRDGHHQMEDWVASINACRDAHETYATYMSTAHVEDSLDVLAGNLRYLEYWRVGEALHERLDRNGTGLKILEFLFHQFLSARPMSLDVPGGPAHLAPALRLVNSQPPNERLRRSSVLARTDPDFVAGLIGAISADHTVEDNLDAVARVLEQYGLPTLTCSEQTTAFLELQDLFNAKGSEHQISLTVRSRATSLEDQLDYISREAIQLHQKPLPLLIGTGFLPEGKHPFTLFVRDDNGVGPHLWTVVLTADVLRSQFDTDIEEGVFFGFLSCDREGRSDLITAPAAFLMMIDETPELVTQKLAKAGLRTIMTTTLSSLASVVKTTPFSSSEPLFVIIDEPIRPFLLGLMEELRVLWTTVSITGDRLLHAVILTVDDDRPLHFVWVGTMYTLKPVLEWLRRDSGTFTYVGANYPDVGAEMFAMLRHLLGTFATLGFRK